VIEVLVSEGDELALEQGIVTVESDKASMELPADQPGKVVRVLVKVGDKVNQGTPLVEIEPSGQTQENQGEASEAKESPAAGTTSGTTSSTAPVSSTAKSNTDAKAEIGRASCRERAERR